MKTIGGALLAVAMASCAVDEAESPSDSKACDVEAAEDVLADHFATLTEGDIPEALSMVADDPSFEWYAVFPDRWEEPGDRQTLDDFLAAREWEILRPTISGSADASAGIVNLGFVVWDGYIASWRGGKAAINCADRRIIVLVLGDPDGVLSQAQDS